MSSIPVLLGLLTGQLPLRAKRASSPSYDIESLPKRSTYSPIEDCCTNTMPGMVLGARVLKLEVYGPFGFWFSQPLAASPKTRHNKIQEPRPKLLSKMCMAAPSQGYSGTIVKVPNGNVHVLI